MSFFGFRACYTVRSVGLLSTQSSLEIIPTRSAFRIPRLLQSGLRKPTRDIGFPDEFECKVNKIIYNSKHNIDIFLRIFGIPVIAYAFRFLHTAAFQANIHKSKNCTMQEEYNNHYKLKNHSIPYIWCMACILDNEFSASIEFTDRSTTMGMSF